MKKFICVFLAAFILAASLPAFAISADSTESLSFKDVKEGSWYYNCVNYCADNGIMVGVSDNEFQPDANMTRAMFVAVLYRLSGESAPNTATPFNDVPENTWYTDSVKWAHKNGIASGISKTEFAPNDRVTREQMCAFMVRYSDYKGYSLKLGDTLTTDMYLFEKVINAMTENENMDVFGDIYDISDYALSPVIKCEEYGIVSGMPDGTFEPKGYATRAQVCSVIIRFVRNLTSESNAVPGDENTEKYELSDIFGKYAEIQEITENIDENTTKITTSYNVLDGSESSYTSEEIYNKSYPAPVSYKKESSDGSKESSVYSPEDMHETVLYHDTDGALYLREDFYYKTVNSEETETVVCDKYVVQTQSVINEYELLYDGLYNYGFIKRSGDASTDNITMEFRYKHEMPIDQNTAKITDADDETIELVYDESAKKYTFKITYTGEDETTITDTVEVDISDPENPTAVSDMLGGEKEDIGFTNFTAVMYLMMYMLQNL